MSRTSWGKAKHQVNALKSEIIALLQQGENLEGVYQTLHSQKKLDIGKSTFKRHASAYRASASVPLSSPPKNRSSVSNSANSPETKPWGNEPARPHKTTDEPSPYKFEPPQKSRTFDHNPVVNEAELDALFNGETNRTTNPKESSE